VQEWSLKLSRLASYRFADSGGPGDIVDPEVGYNVPLNESDFVARMEKILAELASNRDHLCCLQRQGVAYVRECLTWDAKAEILTRILNWAVKRGPKPNLPPPKMLQVVPASRS
jgi:hypothetical protein